MFSLTAVSVQFPLVVFGGGNVDKIHNFFPRALKLFSRLLYYNNFLFFLSFWGQG
uniref:Uncharacterized protein n=1 Tax=Anguilla anguilla TaxID=7936 RepID=A0A0E9WVZ8_ANGAN